MKENIKKALIVGINKYANPAWDLQGCVGDAEAASSYLHEYYNFPRENIRLVTDERATKINIEKRLDWLVRDSSDGDTLVFYYAGHGSQIVDRNGDELNDYKDECLCTHNHDWDNALTDDILGSYFSRVPEGCHLVVILDCCSSGTGSRDIRKNIRYLPPPADIYHRSLDTDKVLPIRKVSSVVMEANHILLSACRDDQVAEEIRIGGKRRGVFSYYLEKVLTEEKTTYREVYTQVVNYIKEKGYDQVPQLEHRAGEENKIVFSVEQKKKSLPVDEDDGLLSIILHYLNTYPDLYNAFKKIMTPGRDVPATTIFDLLLFLAKLFRK